MLLPIYTCSVWDVTKILFYNLLYLTLLSNKIQPNPSTSFFAFSSMQYRFYELLTSLIFLYIVFFTFTGEPRLALCAVESSFFIHTNICKYWKNVQVQWWTSNCLPLPILSFQTLYNTWQEVMMMSRYTTYSVVPLYHDQFSLKSSQNTHMGCILWIQILICILLQLL